MFPLHRDRLEALWHIMAWVIDQRTHRVGHEIFTQIRTEESFERIYVLECGIKPLVIGCGGENDRHATVNFGHEVIGLCGDDRTGFEWFTGSRFPLFPQSREGEGALTLQSNPHGLLPVSLDLPFIEPSGDDEAAALFESRPKGWFLCHSLSLGVDTLIPNLGVFGPRRDQSPSKHHERPGGAVGLNPDDRDGLRRSEVVARLKERRGSDPKLFGNDGGGGSLSKSSTHLVVQRRLG